MSKQTFILMAVFILSFMGISCADEQKAATQNSEQAQPIKETKLPEVGNKICPVSSEKVGQMGEVVQIEYKGKMYNLCCKMCLKDFNKDPEKFSKKAEEIAEQEKMETEASESNTPTKSE